jgi:energy-coupling factor transporter ATP-binding protein EcfA2
MDRQRAEHLHALLANIEPELAEPALQPLERLLARQGAGEALIVAVVGASGVGKSELINLLAGTRVVAAGPLRPTTTEIAIWGDIDDSYLPGRRVPGPNRPDRVVLIDTPPMEHYPDTVAGLLHLVDAAVLVISPDRYADAITAAVLDTVRENGIPTRSALSMVGNPPPDTDQLVRDAESRLGIPIDAVVADDAGPVRAVLNEMVQAKDDILAERDGSAAAYIAERAGAVVETLLVRADAARVLLDRADASFARATIDSVDLAAAADLEWDEAAVAIAGMEREATDRAVDEWSADIERDGFAPPDDIDPGRWLPEVDSHPINEWYQMTTEAGRQAVRRRWLHPRRSRAVRDQLWRLSIDFGRRPTKSVRKGLRDQLPDLRIEQNAAFVEAIRRAGAARSDAFRARVDPLDGVSPDEIRAAVEALRDGEDHKREAKVNDDA